MKDTVTKAELPEAIQSEQREFSQRVDAYLHGKMGPDDFKKCRLPLGIYGIRGLKDRQMLRVKVPAGHLNAEQLEGLGDLVEAFGTGHGHLTTRQDVQIYDVPIARTPELLRELETVWLTTREACGNSVRNVTACPLAGLCADEPFDVLPYSLAATKYFLRNPVSQALPRKFKVSFSGCAHDRAMAPIHDIGAIATVQGGRAGFRLYVGGGLGAVPRAADLLEPFTETARLLPTMEAIIRVFDRHGERDNKSRARMKFLIARVGIGEFRRLVFEAREELLAHPERFPRLPDPEFARSEPAGRPALPDAGPAPYRRWLATNAAPQRQPGYAVVTIRLPLGDLTGRQFRDVAVIARRFSRGIAIITQSQDLCLPWVRHEELLVLYETLERLGLGLPEADRIQNLTSCPGADTCQIGITASRGLARALAEVLDHPRYKTDALKDVRLKISGCPNSCGQHQIADVGFYGASRSVDGQLVPHYQLLLGGWVEDGRVRFGRPILKIPARHVPEALERLLQHYLRERIEGERFRAFVDRLGAAAFQGLLRDLTEVGTVQQEPAAYRDWGQTTAFTLAGMGQGECAG